MNSEFKRDFDFSNPNFFKASDKEDKKYGIDFWIFNIPVAHRKRRIQCPSDITIRYKRNSGAKTEYNKILDGTLRARLFVFEFTDKIIFSNLESIKMALLNKQFNIIPNYDQETSLAVIKLENLKYFELMRSRNLKPRL
jgi:hypothetical protein